MDDAAKEAYKASDPNLEPKVTGIGGIFFYTQDAQKSRSWYAENLGLEVNQWGSSFESRNAHRPQEINYLQWSPMENAKEYFSPSEKQYMINYRVQNLEALLTKLRKNDVQILGDVQEFEYGKFAHIMDHEGNKIELWEPVDQVFTDMDLDTTK
ncbi:MAG: VOC family protein [Weeksellaceae bacterium]|nr:VOC family protein [Weeksellaceae bacterium]